MEFSSPRLVGSFPPARVPPSESQPPPPPDNNGSFASKLFGLFGLKSAPKTQVASADPTTLERGAHSATTGSIVAPKVKLPSQIYTVSRADPREPYKNEPTENDASELQQTVAAQPKSVLQQVANAAWSLESDNTVSALPTEPTESLRKPLERITEVRVQALNLALVGRWIRNNLHAPILKGHGGCCGFSLGNAT